MAPKLHTTGRYMSINQTVGGKDFSSVKPDLSAWNWLEKLCLVSLKTLKAPGCRSVDFLYLL